MSLLDLVIICTGNGFHCFCHYLWD